MSNAALCATSTVSLQKLLNRGNTVAMAGWPASIAGSMPWMRTDAGGSERLGSISWSKISPCSNLPLTMRMAPIEMISSPSVGLRPVVSVSNTV